MSKEKALGTGNPNKAGLMLGVLMGGWHLLWAIVVAAGWAQAVLNFVFWMHFIRPPYTAGPFNVGVAVILVAVTAVIGYVMGYVLAERWNSIHK